MIGYNNILEAVHKETNKMHFFVCIFSKIFTLHVSNLYNVHHQEFHM